MARTRQILPLMTTMTREDSSKHEVVFTGRGGMLVAGMLRSFFSGGIISGAPTPVAIRSLEGMEEGQLMFYPVPAAHPNRTAGVYFIDLVWGKGNKVGLW